MNKKGGHGVSIVLFGLGTLISIFVSLLLANQFPSPSQYIIGLLSEILVCLLSIGVFIHEKNTRLINTLQEHNVFSSAGSFSASSDDPCFSEKYKTIKKQLKELSIGHYELSDLSAVYNDDIESARVLKKGEKLYSMCPIGGSENDVALQFKNKSFVASMEQHYHASRRGVVVQRIYIFEKQHLLHDVPECKYHLNEAIQNGIDVRLILLDEHEFADAIGLPRDFIIFGNNKVSIGKIGPSSRVDGADVWAPREVINEYRKKYEKLLIQSEKYICSDQICSNEHQR